MVTWNGDGHVSGYNASTGSPSDLAFLLASPGNVDLQGITRLQYDLPAGLSDQIRATGVLVFDAGDAADNPGKRLTATMFIAPANYFAAGVTPTPEQMLAIGANLRAYRSPNSLAGAGSLPFAVNGPTASALQSNTKYWIMVMPTAVASMSLPANYVNDKCVDGSGRANAISRGVSVWTNRTPAKPVITAPAPGLIVNAGVTVPFAFTSADPDLITGSLTRQYTDLAGVQVQYAASPTPDNPSPSWLDLPIANFAADALGKGWHIVAAASLTAKDEGAQALFNNRSMSIRAGSNTLTSMFGALPSGSWQLRMRTFDYGHPYATDVPPLAQYAGAYTPSTYPASNTSPWSDPVNVAVTAQVPPPVPLSPIDDVAVSEGLPITLSWLYKNTYTPPFAQASRRVQIRKVGDPAWTELINGAGSSSSYLVPPYSAGTPGVPDGPTTQYQSNGDFENGLPNGARLINYPTPGAAATVITGSVGAGTTHGGVKAIKRTGDATNNNGLMIDFTLDPAHTRFDFDLWAKYIGNNPDTGDSVYAIVRWLDSAGTDIGSGGYTSVTGSGGPWVRLKPFAPFSKPAGAVTARFLMAPSWLVASGGDITVDDVSFTGFVAGTPGTPATGFPALATTEFEWRVQVTDTNGVTSNFSEVGRFWIVPAPSSGEVRPLPADTIDAATLGCGTYRVFVFRRGGKRRVGEIRNISSLDWGRVRDDISTSKIVISGWDIDCGNLLAKLQTWAYEIVLFRDNGYTMDRVWEGPITLLTYERDSVTIQAKDVMGYAYRRIIRQQMIGSSTETVVSRAARALQNGFAVDDPNMLAYLTILSRTDDATTVYRSTPAYSRTVFEEIDEMAAKSGLDYTTVGRSVVLWGTGHGIGTLPEFRDEDLGATPIVSEYGMSMTNRYVISDGAGVWGEANRLPVSGNDDVYGLVEFLSSSWADDAPAETGTYTGEQQAKAAARFAAQAEKSIGDRYPPPVVVRVPDNTSLNPGLVLSIQQLVPGVVVPLRSTGTLRVVVANQKLDTLNVTVREGVETISITLSPYNRDDASTDVEVTA